MTRRADFNGARQAQALRSLLTWSRRALRTQSGKGLREIADELGMSPKTLSRYLSGETPLCSDQFATFAAAFETDEGSLLRACFPAVNAPSLETLLANTTLPDDEQRQLLSSLRSVLPLEDLAPETRRAIATAVDAMRKKAAKPEQGRRRA